MLNKQFLYGANITTVLDYDINPERERLYVFTDRRQEPYDRPLESAHSFLEEFRPVNNLPATTEGNNRSKLPATGLMLTDGNLGSQLKEILLKNIEDVQKSPEYVPQAEVVNDNVKTLLDMAKLELEHLKLAAKLKDQDF